MIHIHKVHQTTACQTSPSSSTLIKRITSLGLCHFTSRFNPLCVHDLLLNHNEGHPPVIAIAISHIIVPPAAPSHHCVVWRHPASRLYLPDSRVQHGDVGLHGLQGTEPRSRHSGHPSVTSSCRHARNAGLFMPASRATVDDIFSLNLQSSKTRGTPGSHAHCLFTAAFNIRKFGNLLFGAARPARRHT